MPAGTPATLSQVYDAVDGTREELGGKIDRLADAMAANNLANASRLTALEIVQAGHSKTIDAHTTVLVGLQQVNDENAGAHRVKSALWGAAGALACGGGVTGIVWLISTVAHH